LNNSPILLLIGIALLIYFYTSPIEANVGLTSNEIVSEGIDSVGSRFSGKRAITTERGPIEWISFEKEVNDNFVVANKVFLGRKMKGEIGSEDDRDCFYTDVPSVMKVSFKLETYLPLPMPGSNIGVGVTVYAEDQETILGTFISDTSNPGGNQYAFKSRYLPCCN